MNVLEEIETADEAFISASTPKVLNGVQLEPFSLMRQSVALEITGFNVETAFFEAVVRVWLCTLPPKDVVKARRDKDQAILDAFNWAEAQGFSFSNWAPLRDLYKRINDEIQVTTDVSQDTNGQSPKVVSGSQPAS